MTDLERIVAQLDLDPPYAPRAVDGWWGIYADKSDDGIQVCASSELSLAALDAWYSAVVDGKYSSKPSDSESDWEACRAAVRGELITIEQLAILLRLAGPKPSPQSSSPAGPTG